MPNSLKGCFSEMCWANMGEPQSQAHKSPQQGIHDPRSSNRSTLNLDQCKTQDEVGNEDQCHDATGVRRRCTLFH